MQVFSSKQIFAFTIFLPSATKLRRLCFYRRLSVHGGRGCLPQCMVGYHPQSRHPPSRADTPPEQTPSWSRHPRSRHPPPEQTPPRADNPREQTPPQSRHPPPRNSHCCGRYASYWNAFLLIYNFIIYIVVQSIFS